MDYVLKFGNATLVCIALVLGLCLPTPATEADRTRDRSGMPAVNQYLELIAEGNYDIAAEIWAPEALERASRFGIEFGDIPLKVDCASPVIRNLDADRGVLPVSINSFENLPGGLWTRLLYTQVVYGDDTKYNYYAQARGDWAWLGFAQDYYAADWEILETAYLRVHVHPDVRKYLNDQLLAETDRFVEAMCDTLGIPKERRHEVQTKKIEYFYCPSDTIVQLITGHLTKGTLDLASNDIISSVFPHFHEMLHLLVNIRLQRLPLYTMPIMREGAAVKWGGRWGKHQSALIDLAVFLYQERLVEMDSLLTMGGFEAQAGADIVYPVAGLFASYLTDKLGAERYFDLYLSLSGTFDRLYHMSVSDAKAELIRACGFTVWDELAADFDAFLDRYLELHAGAKPGVAEKLKHAFTYEGVTVAYDNDWMSFEFVDTTGDPMMAGNLLFAPINGLQDMHSSLFEEHYGNAQPFPGYRFGIRVDKNEAGLYDYVTNQLVAKYIWGISPSEDYCDSEDHRIRIRFRRDFVGKLLPKEGQVLLLPN